jgi:hypothetical protein
VATILADIVWGFQAAFQSMKFRSPDYYKTGASQLTAKLVRLEVRNAVSVRIVINGE